MLTTACATSTIEKVTDREAIDAAACELSVPIDELANAIIDNQKNTPDEVIIKGTTVIKGFDGLGCS
jgi:hypothetical protein